MQPGKICKLGKFLPSNHTNVFLLFVCYAQPNDVKSGRNFHDDLVQHQVRYLGLMENVRVRRAGFAYRQEYGQCLAR